MADRQKRTINDVDVESTEDEVRPTKRRKARTSINHLCEIRPGTQYHLVGQYGGPESPIYVIEITVDGKVFQGIGPSKKRAKMMAAEFALVQMGSITAVTDSVPDVTQEPYCYDDFTADINDTNSILYYDFYQAEATRVESACAAAGDGDVAEKTGDDKNSFESKMIGKNALTILRELHPGAFYHFVAMITEDARPRFVMAVNIDGQKFKGSGINKRLAKARAAREALRALDKMDFGMAEDGMPVYEGDERIWLDYKAKLEREAEAKLENVLVDNPIHQLNEYFPEAKITFPETTERPDIESFFICQVVVEGTTYEGSGLSKKDAKSHASSVALNDLKERGVLEQKDREFEANRLEREEKKKANDKSKVKENADRKVGGFKTAVAKLNDGFQNLEYKLIAETPLRNTCLIAFTMAINIRGKNYVGVGKNKKMAKMDAAEKALHDLGMWTEEDEAEKVRMKKEEENLDSVEETEEWTGTQGRGQSRGGWGQGEAGGWGATGGGGANWNGKSNQYAGYGGCGYNTGWGYGGGGNGGYGPGMGVQQGGWGQVDANTDGGYNAYPPMMQELNVIMGSMFESTFGQNPWKSGSEGGGGGGQPHQGRGWGFGGRPGRGAFQPRGNLSNRGNMDGSAQFGNPPMGNTQFGNPPMGNAQFGNPPMGNTQFGNPPMGNMNPPETSATTMTSFSPSSNSVAPSGNSTVKNSEPYYGRGFSGPGVFAAGDISRGTFENSAVGGSTKYSNFRSAGFETGFKPSPPVQPMTPSNAETQASIAAPTFGPYGTPVVPPPQAGQALSGNNFQKSNPVGNVAGGYDAGAGNQTTLNAATANNTAGMSQGSGAFRMGGTGNSMQQGSYQSGTADGYSASEANNSGMGQYQDFMSTFQMTGGFPSGNSTSSFQADNIATSGYSSRNYSSGGNYSSGTTGYQSGSLDANYSSSQTNAYGNQAPVSGVQSAGYQGSQSDYSMGNYQAGNTTTSSYTGDNLQGTPGDGTYSADSSAGYYGMYGSGYNQGYNNFDYGTTSSYGMNTGYAMGGYQNTGTDSSGYGYGYSSATGNNTATDSYSTTTTNKTTW